jgi:2',3'-cyclic-nucleotide 2'-phosphodiesterase (5'-nucleotidase family)
MQAWCGKVLRLWSVALGLCAVVADVAASGDAARQDAIFVLIGDQHSAYGRSAQFVAHVDRLAAENPDVPLAVLINGDVFEMGNAVAKRSAGEVDFAVMAALAKRVPVVVNLGNHEPEFYDVGETVKRLRATGVVVIGSLLSRETGEPFAPAGVKLVLKKSLRQDAAAVATEAPGSLEVVIVGVATDQLSQYRAAVRPQLDLTNPAVWAREKFPTWFAQAPVRVVLSHSGVRYDREIFPIVPDGALFAGAHDHLRLVHRMGRTAYVHSGAWQSHFTVARLRQERGGAAAWQIEQVVIEQSDPSDAEIAAVVREARAKHLAPEDLEVLGRLTRALNRESAAWFVARAVRLAAGVDAVLIGNTTFGDGLPAGDVTREAFDACVRFDGTIWVAEVSGARLREIVGRANQNLDTPFEKRSGEFQFADSLPPQEIVSERRYRMATTDWGMKNRARYFGSEEIAFVERPELKLKAIVAEALKNP